MKIFLAAFRSSTLFLLVLSSRAFSIPSFKVAAISPIREEDATLFREILLTSFRGKKLAPSDDVEYHVRLGKEEGLFSAKVKVRLLSTGQALSYVAFLSPFLSNLARAVDSAFDPKSLSNLDGKPYLAVVGPSTGGIPLSEDRRFLLVREILGWNEWRVLDRSDLSEDLRAMARLEAGGVGPNLGLTESDRILTAENVPGPAGFSSIRLRVLTTLGAEVLLRENSRPALPEEADRQLAEAVRHLHATRGWYAERAAVNSIFFPPVLRKERHVPNWSLVRTFAGVFLPLARSASALRPGWTPGPEVGAEAGFALGSHLLLSWNLFGGISTSSRPFDLLNQTWPAGGTHWGHVETQWTAGPTFRIGFHHLSFHVGVGGGMHALWSSVSPVPLAGFDSGKPGSKNEPEYYGSWVAGARLYLNPERYGTTFWCLSFDGGGVFTRAGKGVFPEGLLSLRISWGYTKALLARD